MRRVYFKYGCKVQKKAKLTLEQNWRPRARRRGISTFINLAARWVWLANATPQPPYPRDRHPLPFVQEAGWSPGLQCTRAENLALTGIWSTGRATVASRCTYCATWRGLQTTRITETGVTKIWV
jgi:hypothetical protein